MIPPRAGDYQGPRPRTLSFQQPVMAVPPDDYDTNTIKENP